MVVVQQATQPLAALDLARGSAGFGAGENELVVQPLVVAFKMTMTKTRTTKGPRARSYPR